MYQTAHDFSMWDALYDYLEDKTAVAIMGGHDLSKWEFKSRSLLSRLSNPLQLFSHTGRLDPQYELVVKLGRELAQKGFLVATGGGPGAMEVQNKWKRKPTTFYIRHFDPTFTLCIFLCHFAGLIPLYYHIVYTIYLYDLLLLLLFILRLGCDWCLFSTSLLPLVFGFF